jgi:hypothetical protein
MSKGGPGWGGVFVVGLVLAICGVGLGPMILRECDNDRILKVGTPASARVLSIRPTGNLHNDQPEVKIKLEVTGPERAFEATVTTYMSPVYLPQFQPGAVVAVKYDPKHRRDVALVPAADIK